MTDSLPDSLFPAGSRFFEAGSDGWLNVVKLPDGRVFAVSSLIDRSSWSEMLPSVLEVGMVREVSKEDLIRFVKAASADRGDSSEA